MPTSRSNLLLRKSSTRSVGRLWRRAKPLMVMSASALPPRPYLVELARARGGQIIVPTGALLGFDAVIAAALGTINSVQITTRKPPAGLAGAPYLVKNGISVDPVGFSAARFQG